MKCVVLLLDADEAGRAAASDMAQQLAAVNIETRSVELPAKDAAGFIAATARAALASADELAALPIISCQPGRSYGGDRN